MSSDGSPTEQQQRALRKRETATEPCCANEWMRTIENGESTSRPLNTLGVVAFFTFLCFGWYLSRRCNHRSKTVDPFHLQAEDRSTCSYSVRSSSIGFDISAHVAGRFRSQSRCCQTRQVTTNRLKLGLQEFACIRGVLHPLCGLAGYCEYSSVKSMQERRCAIASKRV